MIKYVFVVVSYKTKLSRIAIFPDNVYHPALSGEQFICFLLMEDEWYIIMLSHLIVIFYNLHLQKFQYTHEQQQSFLYISMFISPDKEDLRYIQ